MTFEEMEARIHQEFGEPDSVYNGERGTNKSWRHDGITIACIQHIKNEELMNEFRRLSAECKELTNVESKEKVP